jgi:hypothetical protein
MSYAVKWNLVICGIEPGTIFHRNTLFPAGGYRRMTRAYWRYRTNKSFQHMSTGSYTHLTHSLYYRSSYSLQKKVPLHFLFSFSFLLLIFRLLPVCCRRLVDAYIELGGGLKILLWPCEVCEASDPTKSGVTYGSLGHLPTSPFHVILLRLPTTKGDGEEIG